MTGQELREKYLEFFKSKGHTIIPSASLIPENDPTTLFTSSGMQPMVPYLLGEIHPMGTRIVDSQKCFRAVDIEEIGDNRHTTMFEMLGNWSLGDYFKKEQIRWMFEFLTKEVGLNPKNLYVTVFRGYETLKIPRDNEAVNTWQELFSSAGINSEAIDFSEKNGMQNGRIFYYAVEKNWWSRSGVPANMPLGEPGGPDSEIFWDFGAELKLHENSEFKEQLCHVNCDCGRFLEIGNNVFMQYVKTEKGFELLPKGNIDFGGGLERILAAKNGDPDIFKTDLFMPIINKIEEISGKKYGESAGIYDMRVITDHLKAATFLIADGVVPSNTQQGYVLRRLIRRAIRYSLLLGIENNFTKLISEVVIEIYKEQYKKLEENRNTIFIELENEEKKFRGTLIKGLEILNKTINNLPVTISEGIDYQEDTQIFAKRIFDLYQTHGFPLELILEELKNRNFKKFGEEKIIQIFNEEFKKHQELSRTASAGLFKGGLADSNVETTKLHTAAHLMLSGLRKVLGDGVFQKGSNITAERLRFDFTHIEKMTDDQIKEVENFVNEAILVDADVLRQEMSLSEAKASGAMGVFDDKYGEKVNVYTVSKNGVVFSREICGGPHVDHTGVMGHFKIQKEESSSAGIRRIKAVLI
ncbi:MAG: alanine--tRNA ligase [Candidatus Cloacimonetes bacterium]|nr:alanine--tRNA ligase [Candidatus Cloacimonadota bacterium]